MMIFFGFSRFLTNKIFFREGLRSEDALEKISNECQQDENIEIFVDSIKSSSRGVLR